MSVWGDYNIDSKPDKNSIKKRTLQIFKAVFSSSHVWMWELGHKDECQRIYVFESWCWRRLRVPWTARISNQSIPKEINHEYSLEGLMLKLKLQYFGHLMQRANSLEKTPMLGRNEGRRRRLGEKAGWYYWLDVSLSKLQEMVKDTGQVCCSLWGHKESVVTFQLNKNNGFSRTRFFQESETNNRISSN